MVHADLPDQELALGGVVTGGHEVGGVLVDVVHTVQEHHGVAAFHHRLRAPLGSASTSSYKAHPSSEEKHLQQREAGNWRYTYRLVSRSTAVRFPFGTPSFLFLSFLFIVFLHK